MSVSVQLNTPLADALNSVVQPKLVEVGWSSGGGDDSALAEYVILMLVNGKTQEQIAAELANDLLNLGPDDTEAVEFSKWLFEQVETLDRQMNGGGDAQQSVQDGQADQQPQPVSDGQAGEDAMGDVDGSRQDAEMGDAGTAGENVPTGPKNMRNQKQGGRGRLLGQLSKAMDRSSDSVLHRVRNNQGSGRIDSHNREPPKGPRGFQIRNGHGRGGQGRQMMNNGNMGMGRGGMGMPPPGSNMMAPMSSDQQMQMMAMFEEQTRMMAQFMPGFVPPAINPAFQQQAQQQQQQQGRSLFERAEHQPQHHQRNPHFQQRRGQHAHQADAKMDVEMGTDQGSQGGSDQPPSTDSVCRYNLRCTNKDCPYAHQSPAAPEGTTVDVSDTCSFGAACKNRKCVARHPSPAQKTVHQSEEICRFFPNCTNPHCHFKHPDMPLCRNGADCSTQGCKFTHLQTPCRFNPCLNRSCPYKHAEGQRGAFTDKVWTAQDADKPHVSERRFVSDENADEELIKPGADGNAPTADGKPNGNEEHAQQETNIIT